MTRCYWVESPGRGILRDDALPDPATDELILDAEFSGISPGTERLVGRGLVPSSCESTMACLGMKGTFALPIAYGYSLVGRLESGDRVFTMHPHQERAVVHKDQVVPLPDDVPSARATLLPNLETALNAVWDAELRASERVVIIGAGAVGALLAFVLNRSHEGDVTVVDANDAQVERARRLPWVAATSTPGDAAHGGHEVAFHATGSGPGLQLALDAVGFEGRVIDLSWYGDKPVTLRLGDTFHHQRKRILASQVASIAPRHRAAGRLARTRTVLGLLGDPELDALLGDAVPFATLPEYFAAIYGGQSCDICPLVRYESTS